MVQHFAPVLISVYNRPKHFMECIDSLSRNSIASETPLFVAIDAPSREIDVEPNEKIRKYASGISGFKSVHLFLREKNLGARTNVLQAREIIFSEYDRLIMSEDDNVFSPFFLTFINNGLVHYEHNERVFAICGYNYPIRSPQGYQEDIYFAKAFSAWGYGLWKVKYNSIDWLTQSFWSDFKSPFFLRQFNRTVGDHVFPSLFVSKQRGSIYGDTAICTHLFKNDMVSAFPVVSLVRNMGHDGTGLHCGNNQEKLFSSQKLWDKPKPPVFSSQPPREDTSYQALLNEYFHMPIFKKTYYYLAYLKKIFSSTITNCS